MSQKTNDETRELDMYMKHLILKSSQCVVNSRTQDNKISTKCKVRVAPYSADWFNLSLPENFSLLEDIKTLYGGKPLDPSIPLKLDIFLITNENETMLLEEWTFNRSPLLSKEISKSTVYDQLTTLLKSLVLISRILPAYILSKRQNSSTYILSHKMRLEEPIDEIPEDFKQHILGQIQSPVGTLTAKVAWKTRLQFAPKRKHDIMSVMGEPMLQFTPPFSSDNTFLANAAELKAAFGLPENYNRSLVNTSLYPEDEVPFSNLLECSRKPMVSSPSPKQVRKQRHRNLSETAADIILEGSEDEEEEEEEGKDKTSDSQKSSDQEKLEELKVPFAFSDEEVSELYRDCQNVPQLNMFEKEEDFITMETLIDQLSLFHSKAPEIDEFVDSLQNEEDEVDYD